MERGGVCLRGDLFEEGLVWRRDLDDKGLGQNKVLCSFSGVELPIINYHAGSPTLPALRRKISGYPPASGSRIALTRIPLFRLFLVASFSAFLSMSCWSPLFSLQRVSRLDCWSSHGRSGVWGHWCCCRLLRMVPVESADHLLQVHDGQKRFSGVFFFRKTLLCN